MAPSIEQPSQADDESNRTIDRGSEPLPAFEAMNMITSLMEVGTGVLRTQQRMFAGILGAAEEVSRSGPLAGEVENGPQPDEELQAEHDLIAARAWELAGLPSAGGDLDNWLQAERELRAAGRIRPA